MYFKLWSNLKILEEFYQMCTPMKLWLLFVCLYICLYIISWLESPSAVILEHKKIKSITVSIVSPTICHEVMGLEATLWGLIKGHFSMQKTNIMASSPITSWQIDGKTMETVIDFIFFGFKITADSWLQPRN